MGEFGETRGAGGSERVREVGKGERVLLCA